MQVVGWTSNYQETLKELGLEDSDIGFPEGPDRGMTLLVSKYITRMRATLHTWFVNILQASQPHCTCASSIYIKTTLSSPYVPAGQFARPHRGRKCYHPC
jgi:hypothetical protein